MMLYTLFLLVIITKRIDSFNIIHKSDSISPYLYNISKTVSRKSHFAGFISIILDNTTDNTADSLLEFLHKNLTEKIIVTNVNDKNFQEDYKKMSLMKSIGYVKMILIFKNCTDISNLIVILNFLPFYNSRTKILITLECTPRIQELDDIFQAFWNHKYINVVTIFTKGNNLQVYTLNPYLEKENSLQNFTKQPEKVFYNKHNNIHGYTLKTLLFKEDDFSKFFPLKHPNGTPYYVGHEITLLETFSKKLNGKISFYSTINLLKPGERNPWRETNDINPNISAIKIRIITEKEIDLLNTEDLLLNEDLKGVSESVYPHTKDDLMVIMKRPGEIPFYKYLFMVFGIEVWLLFIFLLIIGTVSWSIIGSQTYDSKLNKFINIIRMTTGGSLPLTKPKTPEKLFILFWFYYTLIIITAFTSVLTSELMDVKYYPDIQTLDELNEKGYVISAWQTQINVLRAAFNGTSKADLFNRMEQMPPKYDHIDNSKNNWTEGVKNFLPLHPVILNTERALSILNWRGYTGIFQVVKESPFPNYVAFQVPAKSPFLDVFGVYLRQVTESGLAGYWKMMHKFNGILSKSLEGYEKPHKKLLSISLNHLSAAFIVLIFGLVFSILTFLYEIILNRFKKRTL